MYGKELLDKDVFGMNGWKIGKSKDLVFDVGSWQITHLDIELKGNIEAELGMDSAPLMHNHLPIAISNFQGVGDVITLKATKEEIVSALSAYRHQKVGAPTAMPTTVSQ